MNTPVMDLEIGRCMWFGTHWEPEGLTTAQGDAIEVFSPGWWAVGIEPQPEDFIRAEWRIKGERFTGPANVYRNAVDMLAADNYSADMLAVLLYKDATDLQACPVPVIVLTDHMDSDMKGLLHSSRMAGLAATGLPAGHVESGTMLL